MEHVINGHTVTFEELNSPELNETFYRVSMAGMDFIMALNTETCELEIQGVAPYAAREIQQQISDLILSSNE